MNKEIILAVSNMTGGKKFSKRDWGEDMGYADFLYADDAIISLIKKTPEKELIDLFYDIDAELRKYGLCVRSGQRHMTFESVYFGTGDFNMNEFFDGEAIYMGLSKYWL